MGALTLKDLPLEVLYLDFNMIYDFKNKRFYLQERN